MKIRSQKYLQASIAVAVVFQAVGLNVQYISFRNCRALSAASHPNEGRNEDVMAVMPPARRVFLGRSVVLLLGGSVALQSEKARANQPFELELEKDVLDRLKPETSEQPRIPLPTQSSMANTLEGQISLGDPTSQRRPTGSDIILLTVRSVDEPKQILAGARIPVSRIPSFPVRFLLNEKNVLPSSSRLAWKTAIETTDMVVEAIVCNRDVFEEKRAAGYTDWSNAVGICSDINDSTLGGRGYAKLLIFNSGSVGSDPVIIRAPASVVLN